MNIDVILAIPLSLEIVRRVSPLRAFLKNMVNNGEVNIDVNDDIQHETLIARGGEVVRDQSNGVNIDIELSLWVVILAIPLGVELVQCGSPLRGVLKNMVNNGEVNIDVNDDIQHETLIARGGEVIHPRVQALLSATAGTGVMA